MKEFACGALCLLLGALFIVLLMVGFIGPVLNRLCEVLK